MKHSIIKSKIITIAAAVILCCSALFIYSSARAQGGCNCLSVSTSVAHMCDTCRDSIYYTGLPPHEIADTIVLCDTCYTFAITNNCPYAISAIQLYDSNGTGGVKTLHFGCSAIQNITEDTNWKYTNNSDGLVTVSDSSSSGGCLGAGETLLISICNPLQRGDTISLFWGQCGGPQYPLPPWCLVAETVTVP